MLLENMKTQNEALTRDRGDEAPFWCSTGYGGAQGRSLDYDTEKKKKRNLNCSESTGSDKFGFTHLNDT